MSWPIRRVAAVLAVTLFSRVAIAQSGACCLPDGDCMVTDQATCVTLCGMYEGGMTCGDKGVMCATDIGACCLCNGMCVDRVTVEECMMVSPGRPYHPGGCCKSVTCLPSGAVPPGCVGSGVGIALEALTFPGGEPTNIAVEGAPPMPLQFRITLSNSAADSGCAIEGGTLTVTFPDGTPVSVPGPSEPLDPGESLEIMVPGLYFPGSLDVCGGLLHAAVSYQDVVVLSCPRATAIASFQLPIAFGALGLDFSPLEPVDCFGSETTFSYFVTTGVGGASIDEVGVVHGDGACSPVAFIGGDTNDNGILEAPEFFIDGNGNCVFDPGEFFIDANGNDVWDEGEEWEFTCTAELAASVTTDATASGSTAFGASSLPVDQTATQQVIIIDPMCVIEGPALVCPGQRALTYTVSEASGLPEASFVWSITGDAEFCSDESGRKVCVNVGSTCGSDVVLTVDVTVDDCSSQCAMAVQVDDQVAPEIECPDALAVPCGVPTPFEVTAQDDCPAPVTIMATASFDPPGSGVLVDLGGGAFEITFLQAGTAVVTGLAIDGCGNLSACEFQVFPTLCEALCCDPDVDDDAGEGDCDEANGTPCCRIESCCEAVCFGEDPMPGCCEVEWDQECADHAAEICIPSLICPGKGSCFEPNGTPGCDDEACCELVCTVSVLCCVIAWDAGCAAQAEIACGASAGSPPGGRDPGDGRPTIAGLVRLDAGEKLRVRDRLFLFDALDLRSRVRGRAIEGESATIRATGSRALLMTPGPISVGREGAAELQLDAGATAVCDRLLVGIDAGSRGEVGVGDGSAFDVLGNLWLGVDGGAALLVDGGRISVGGDYRQSRRGELRFRIDGTRHEAIDVGGTAFLGGSLVVELGDTAGVSRRNEVTLLRADRCIGAYANVSIACGHGLQCVVEHREDRVVLVFE